MLAEETWGGTLHAIRSLSKARARVFVAVAGTGAAIYGRSRYCTGARDFDASDPQVFCSAVLKWYEEVSPGQAPTLVLPLSDRLVEFLHHCRDRFDAHFELMIPRPNKTERFLDKAESFRLAEEVGLAVPPWVAVSTPADLEAADALTLPVIVRPRRWSTVGESYFKIERYYDPRELRQGLTRLLGQGAELVAQEWIPGGDDRVEWVVLYRSPRSGTIVTCTGRKRRQDSPEGGVMVWGQAEVIPEARQMAECFVRGASFSGPGGLEVKEWENQRFFVEFNPRLEAIHFVASRAGVDTVRACFEDFVAGGKKAGPLEQQRASGWIGNAWLTRLSRTKDLKQALRDVAAFAFAPRKVFAIWSLWDPLPGVLVTLRLFTSWLRTRRARA